MHVFAFACAQSPPEHLALCDHVRAFIYVGLRALKKKKKEKNESKVNSFNETLPPGRSSGLVKTLVCFMGPHTHHASTPPLAYQGENSQGRESEPRERKMVRMREREEQEVTDLYQPPTSPLSCARKSKLHLLTAFMI